MEDKRRRSGIRSFWSRAAFVAALALCVGLLLLVLVPAAFAQAPTVNGAFYGDGDYTRYHFLGYDSAGAGSALYYYLDGTRLYVTVVVSTAVNDNVFASNLTGDSLYTDSADWPSVHTFKDLYQSDHLALECKCGDTTWVWGQDTIYAVDSSGTKKNFSQIDGYTTLPAGWSWRSDVYGPDGTTTNLPPGLLSSSSIVWSLNNTTWGFEGRSISNWKSPDYVPDANSVLDIADNWPTWSDWWNWEWPLVYEMSFDVGSCGSNSIIIDPYTAHNSPFKSITPDVPFDPVELMDLGDLPEDVYGGYPTLKASGGAQHKIIVGGPRLGAIVDAEPDGQPDTDAEGDDTFNGTDDEDGVIFNLWTKGGTGSVDVTVWVTPTATAYLDAWIDWNHDGVFADYFTDDEIPVLVVEQIAVSVRYGVGGTASGTDTLTFNVPADWDDEDTYLRFRLSSAGGLSPTGLAADGEVEDYVVDAGTVPVTLASFEATREGKAVRFVWSTATETGNVGFNLYLETKAGRERLNGELIPSNVVDSQVPQDYAYLAEAVKGDVFFIEDVDIFGGTELHGPFSVGQAYGERPQPEPIDWAAIRAEHEGKAAVRLESVAPRASLEVQTEALPSVGAESGRSLSRKRRPEPPTTPVWESAGPIDLLVNQDGLYRVTYEMLRDAGFDLAGAPASQLALVNQGKSVAIGLVSGETFGLGAYLEFYGQALDTLYTDTNVYILQVDGNLASRATVAKAAPADGAAVVTVYMETLTIENQRDYSFAAPNGDPWYDARMLVYTNPKIWEFSIDPEAYAGDIGPVILSVNMWGGTDWPSQGPDHHAILSFNGVEVADTVFDGVTNQSVSVSLPRGLLHSGANSLQINLPGDTGVSFDLVNLDSYGLTYPRSLKARQDGLIFTGSGAAFQVSGLSTGNAIVYQLSNGGMARLEQVQVAGSGVEFSVTFAGSPTSATYLVSTAEALMAPGIRAGRVVADDIDAVSAQYLVITHPDFSGGLDALLRARKQDGLTVRLVNVGDVYAKFSDGIVDAQAIKDYVAYAAANLGTEYVLLVGGDTYDYRDYLGQGAISFVPSLYAATGELVRYAPVDPLYADTDNDGVPDLAIGRLPVRTSAELGYAVSKILAYANKGYGRSAVFAADVMDGSVSFSGISDAFVEGLPAGWTVRKAYLDDASASVAKGNLVQAINEGSALTSYVGHSGYTEWTFSGLFKATDAAALTNVGRPTVVTQWGCWNTYYVSPSYNTLGHKFMLSGEQGAAAVLGAATLSESSSESALGQLLMPRLTQPGMTLGMAIRDAKQDLAAEQRGLADVLLGWTLLGDPALVVEP